MADLVAIDLPQDDRLLRAVAEVFEAGDALTVLDRRLSVRAQRHALEVMRPTVLLDADGRRRLSGGFGVDEGDALCVLTSGSTADPKVAVLTRDAVVASAVASTAALEIDPRAARWLCCLPCTHIGGLSVLMRSLVTGTGCEVLERPEPSAVAAAARAGATHVSLVATALARMDASAFEKILLGGAAPPSDLPANVVTTYGLTETGSGIVYDGRPLPGVELAIDDPDLTGLGEILVRGPMLLRSFRDRPTSFVAGPDGGGGWLATGDLGRLDRSGLLEVRGRRSEVIVTGAEKVFPGDVERVVAALAGVGDVAVWRRPDPEWGERVVVWIVPEGEPPSLDVVRAEVADQLAPYAAPRELVIVDALPRTPSGKVRRADLESLS